MNLQDKTIVITGAGRGIGRAMALDLARRGANLALLDLQPEPLADTAAACAALGRTARGYTVNVADEAQVDDTMAQVAQDFERLDGLVNNAGITRDGLLLKVKDGQVTGRLGLDAWQAVLNVNLTGVFLCTRAAGEQMIRLGHGGVIINMSSLARSGNVGQSNYSAAKAALVALTTVWARELARHGIRVGAIAPGFTATDILSTMAPEMLDKLLAPVPLKRLGRAEEIAHAAAFIFENDFFTGRCLDVDGGARF